MQLFETIIIWAIIGFAGLYIFRKFYKQWQSLTDPTSTPSCSDGCSGCTQASCDEKKLPTYKS